MTRRRTDVEVRAAGEPPDCPHCGRPGLLAADVPHGWDSPGAEPAKGTIPVVLCATCHIADEHAGPLIAFLLVNEQVTPQNVPECATLIQRWADSIAIAQPDPDRLREEYQAWQDGAL